MDRPRLPTVASTHATGYVVVLVWCKGCHQQKVADLEALIEAGKGDTPLINLRWRCSRCGSTRLTDWVCTSRDAIAVKPWRSEAATRLTRSATRTAQAFVLAHPH